MVTMLQCFVAYRNSSDIIHSGLQNLNLEHFTHNTSVVFAASQFN